MARTKRTAIKKTQFTPPVFVPARKCVPFPIANAAPPKRRYRYRPGTVALREIRQYQKTTHLLIPKSPFARLAREVAQSFLTDLNWSAQALNALQEAAESYIINIMKISNELASFAKRKTIKPVDVKFAARILNGGESWKSEDER